MRNMTTAYCIFCAAVIFIFSASSLAQTVKITPVGSHEGEYCAYDRALIFEDPDGTRLLFDAGRTVIGPDDTRLGRIDAVLLSSMHADHAGDYHISRVDNGTCALPQAEVSTLPHSNTAAIIAGKGAKAFLGSEMYSFIRTKVEDAGGSGEQVEPLSFGGERQIGGVRLAIVPVTHSNGIDSSFINEELAGLLKFDGLTAYTGPANGYILTFSNDLVVYLSGDSGIFADQEVTIRGFYGAELAVINAGGVFTSGPREAAYSINELIRPRAVIPGNMNEAATVNGRIQAGTKTAQLIKMINGIPVFLPLSGRTMEFDGQGRCLRGC